MSRSWQEERAAVRSAHAQWVSTITITIHYQHTQLCPCMLWFLSEGRGGLYAETMSRRLLLSSGGGRMRVRRLWRVSLWGAELFQWGTIPSSNRWLSALLLSGWFQTLWSFVTTNTASFSSFQSSEVHLLLLQHSSIVFTFEVHTFAFEPLGNVCFYLFEYQFSFFFLCVHPNAYMCVRAEWRRGVLTRVVPEHHLLASRHPPRRVLPHLHGDVSASREGISVRLHLPVALWPLLLLLLSGESSYKKPVALDENPFKHVQYSICRVLVYSLSSLVRQYSALVEWLCRTSNMFSLVTLLLAQLSYSGAKTLRVRHSRSTSALNWSEMWKNLMSLVIPLANSCQLGHSFACLVTCSCPTRDDKGHSPKAY